MRVSHGESESRLFPILIGAPQGSVLAALLFRLHVHFLPLHFPRTVNHLFADDLTIVVKGALKERLSDNIKYVQNRAKVALQALENFSDNYLLPVNVTKTKAMLVHNVVHATKPELEDKKSGY
ncbi:unnamed protein product [Rotaria socialis]|uniref:Reverse transcriptase domain-containing protein n=1 Tax=Rotaria socialis TaxID=392032 RepID=A0A820LX40_9BILA|nr:unnamed protein product [Rotaria socialis]CAF4364659.1 unnamed protein product [Rotaria socialis]